ncbi:uncharacterized protein NFIA_079720 [Aspergillus fischeri NRRL 181]|uniref:Ankyrin repeat protein n=1 Tax=Neosartorya fischeri (strain ATCC 1020 / DSM 3700 / CBS 544.65 / FGSC A1164 / JCM 1740 / NRRL 181 / WB 181) TaxID=331117 RepID=A1DF73_NEOFI|nr:Ankyrin repeat protein [Aspergillus fischeri NRRL 181]EAW18030.1 Ankyrin repeat protein [Aspergillus fischeri NRRL 181]
MTPAFHEELLEVYTDSDLAHYIACSPSCTSTSRVFNLSSNLIAKQYEPSDVEDALKATEVASQLRIRGPSVRKIIKTQENAYLIMNRVEGTTLDVVWKELGWFMTVKLGLQLRRFVKILRSITSPTAGSLVTGECRSFWLEDRYGLPANSGPAEITHFFRFWANFTSMRGAMQASKQPQAPDLPDLTFASCGADAGRRWRGCPCSEQYKQICLHREAEAGRVDTVQWILDHSILTVHETGSNGWTPLTSSVFACQGSMTNYLVEHGADPTIGSNPGNHTALHYAAFSSGEADSTLVRYLIQYGANVNAAADSRCFASSGETGELLHEWLFDPEPD